MIDGCWVFSNCNIIFVVHTIVVYIQIRFLSFDALGEKNNNNKQKSKNEKKLHPNCIDWNFTLVFCICKQGKKGEKQQTYQVSKVWQRDHRHAQKIFQIIFVCKLKLVREKKRVTNVKFTNFHYIKGKSLLLSKASSMRKKWKEIKKNQYFDISKCLFDQSLC